MMVWEFLDIKSNGIFYLLLISMVVSLPVSLAASTSLKLVSYNIHGGVGSDGKKDLNRIALVVKSAVPDVVALNEVNHYFLGHRQDEDIAKAIGPEWRSVFGKTFTKPLAEYGNAILTRLPILSSESWLLSDFPHQERRGLLRVTVERDNILFHIFAVHMGLNARMRERHSHEILKIIDQHKDGYCILMGDFNEQRSQSPGTAIANFSNRLKDCAGHYGIGPQVTFPSTRTFRRIDYIWIDTELAATSCYVPTHTDARLASDHLPVVAKVILHDNISEDKRISRDTLGLTYYQDFGNVPPSHTAPGWELTGSLPKGGYIGGVAVVGKEHVWRQSSAAPLQFRYRQRLPASASIEGSAFVKTIATGGGRWSMSLGGVGIEVRHEAERLPQIAVTAGGEVIAEEELPLVGIDPHDWNRYSIAISPIDVTSTSIKCAVVINGIRLTETEVSSEIDYLTIDFTTAGQTGLCEIYVDEVSFRTGNTLNRSRDEGYIEGNHKVIELEERSPSGWLDWW